MHTSFRLRLSRTVAVSPIPLWDSKQFRALERSSEFTNSNSVTMLKSVSSSLPHWLIGLDATGRYRRFFSQSSDVPFTLVVLSSSAPNIKGLQLGLVWCFYFPIGIHSYGFFPNLFSILCYLRFCIITTFRRHKIKLSKAVLIHDIYVECGEITWLCFNFAL